MILRSLEKIFSFY